MRAILAPLFVGTLLLAAASAPAQDTRSVVPGVLRSDGTFRPFVLRAITKGATGTETTGVFTATISFKAVTGIPPGTTVECTLTATAEGESPTGLIDDFVETSSVYIMAGGSTTTCSPSIPYQWLLYGSGDRVLISYTITAPTPTNVSQTQGSFTRTSQGTLATIPMPASGVTTNFSINTRI